MPDAAGAGSLVAHERNRKDAPLFSFLTAKTGPRLPTAPDRIVGRLQFQTDQNALLVRQVTNNLLHGMRQAPDQRGHGNDLVAGGELWLPEQVDDFDFVLAAQVGLANLLQVSKRCD